MTDKLPQHDPRPVLIFFRSEDSGPARRMDSLIAHLARIERDRLRVTVVDVDRSPEYAERFGVDAVPTIVLVADRRVAGRLEGKVSAPTINRMLAQSLCRPEPPVLEALPSPA